MIESTSASSVFLTFALPSFWRPSIAGHGESSTSHSNAAEDLLEVRHVGLRLLVVLLEQLLDLIVLRLVDVLEVSPALAPDHPFRAKARTPLVDTVSTRYLLLSGGTASGRTVAGSTVGRPCALRDSRDGSGSRV